MARLINSRIIFQDRSFIVAASDPLSWSLLKIELLSLACVREEWKQGGKIGFKYQGCECLVSVGYEEDHTQSAVVTIQKSRRSSADIHSALYMIRKAIYRAVCASPPARSCDLVVS